MTGSRSVIPFSKTALAVIYAAFLLVCFASYAVISKPQIGFSFLAEEAATAQLFFWDEDAGYSEERSVRKTYISGPEVQLYVNSDQIELKRLRFDPASKSGAIVLKSAFYKTPFRSFEVRGNKLLSLIQPSQMIDSVSSVESGIAIKWTGKDPILVLDLTEESLQWRFKRVLQILLVSLLGFALFLAAIGHFESAKMQAYARVVLLSLLFTTIVTSIFFPGYMSFDTFYALDSAHNGVKASTWPPMVSYVWRIVGLFDYHPSVMHFAQVFLLSLSVGVIIYELTGRILYSLFVYGLFLLVPVLIGTIATIWKDVLMASFFLAGFASALKFARSPTPFSRKIWFAISFLMLFLAVCSRHNAIVAAAPILLFLIWESSIAVSRGLFARITLVGALAFGATVVQYIGKTGIDHYALPGFEKIVGAQKLMKSTSVMDLAGASLCLEENLFVSLSEDIDLDFIRENYDPRHLNKSISLVNEVDNWDEVGGVMMNTFLDHPRCFVANRISLTQYLTGLNDGRQYIIFTPGIHHNQYGYDLPRSDLRTSYERYIVTTSDRFIVRPWFLWLLSVAAFAVIMFLRTNMLELAALLASGYAYATGLFVFGNAADARLLFYFNTVNVVVISIALVYIFQWTFQKFWKTSSEKTN